MGDTASDIRSGLAAGAIAIGVTTGPDSPDALAAAVANDVLTSLVAFPSWLDDHAHVGR